MIAQPQLENLIDIEEQCQVSTYKKLPFVIELRDDVWVYTSEGDRYIDLYVGPPGSRPGIRTRDRQGIRASLSSSYWLNRVVEWWMTTYARIGQANLLNAFPIELKQINGRSSNGG